MAQTKRDLTDTRVQGAHVEADGGARVLLPAEAAEFLRVSIDQLYHLTSKKRIPFTKIGGALRFDRERLEEFVAGGTAAPETGAAPRAASRKGGRRASNGEGAGRATREGREFKFNTPARRTQ